MDLKVIKLKPETDSAFSIIFEKPQSLHFYPGQYIDYDKPFTVSASPTERFLMLTTRKGRTEFKKALLALRPGDKLHASAPIGTFILDETSPAVFLAGGIGITPFRSMIKYALDQNLKTPITLIYSNSDDDFVFKEELNEWQKLMPNLKIIYHNSSKAGHFTRPPSELLPINYTLSPIYYLSGSPKFVDAMQKILLDLKIDETNIRSDYFDGYE